MLAHTSLGGLYGLWIKKRKGQSCLDWWREVIGGIFLWCVLLPLKLIKDCCTDLSCGMAYIQLLWMWDKCEGYYSLDHLWILYTGGWFIYPIGSGICKRLFDWSRYLDEKVYIGEIIIYTPKLNHWLAYLLALFLWNFFVDVFDLNWIDLLKC